MLKPLRFVWQTDAEGRFVHISRELGEAVGPRMALILGLTWPEVVERLELGNTDGVTRGISSGDTWTAPPVLWPVQASQLAIPVELAGMQVREAGAFAGFRGYGIARRELATVRAKVSVPEPIKLGADHDEPPENAPDAAGTAEEFVAQGLQETRPSDTATTGAEMVPEQPLVRASTSAGPEAATVNTAAAPGNDQSAFPTLNPQERNALRAIAMALRASGAVPTDQTPVKRRQCCSRREHSAIEDDTTGEGEHDLEEASNDQDASPAPLESLTVASQATAHDAMDGEATDSKATDGEYDPPAEAGEDPYKPLQGISRLTDWGPLDHR